LAFRSFGFITAVVITRIVATAVILSVISSSIVIAHGATAIVVVHVLPFVAGRDFDAVVIIGIHFFVGVCIMKQRSRVRFLSPRFILSDLRTGSGSVRWLRSARHSEDAE
jgi:hypothetical protein